METQNLDILPNKNSKKNGRTKIVGLANACVNVSDAGTDRYVLRDLVYCDETLQEDTAQQPLS